MMKDKRFWHNWTDGSRGSRAFYEERTWHQNSFFADDPSYFFDQGSCIALHLPSGMFSNNELNSVLELTLQMTCSICQQVHGIHCDVHLNWVISVKLPLQRRPTKWRKLLTTLILRIVSWPQVLWPPDLHLRRGLFTIRISIAVPRDSPISMVNAFEWVAVSRFLKVFELDFSNCIFLGFSRYFQDVCRSTVLLSWNCLKLFSQWKRWISGYSFGGWSVYAYTIII